MRTKTTSFGKRGTRLAAVAVWLSLLMLLSNLPVKPAESVAAAAQTTLTVGMLEPIDSLNPFIGINDNAYVFYGLVYDFLIAVDEDLNPKPNLAESWCVVQDEYPVGSVWQYNLTHNAKWHDGEPFTADDVVFTMNYQTGINWFSMWAYQPYTLMINHTERIDDYTVRIHFFNWMTKEPTAISFGEQLMIPIVPLHEWEDISPADAGFGYPNEKPIGTGPFMCTNSTYNEFIAGDRLILYRNPDYHLGPVQFDRLVLQFYLEPAAMVVDIQRGAIDMAAFATPNYKNLIEWLENHPNDDIGTYSGLSCTSYSVEFGICLASVSPGNTNYLRHDPAVRKAMAYATNKTFIRDHIYMGYADIGYSLFSKVYGDYYWEPAPGEAYDFNMTKANEILDNAGYYWHDEDKKDYRICDPILNDYDSYTNELKFDILVETELFEDRATAQFLQAQWANVGIQLNPIYVDSATWNNIVYNSMGAFDMSATYWSGDPDPNYLLYTQSSWALSGWSENYYSSAAYDENYSQSIIQVSKEDRLPYVHNCLKHIYEDCAFIVNAYPYGCWAWRTDHFDGWGDWGAHPGRQLSNFWSSNDLFFDLVPVAANKPPTAILDTAGGIVNETIPITGLGWDSDGDPLDYTIEFGDGQNESGAVPANGELSFNHVYTAVNNYSVNLTVYDQEAADINRTTVRVVAVGTNVPPSNVRVLPDPMKGYQVNLSASFKIMARDGNGDPLHVTLDFGDGTAPYETNLTDTKTLMTQTVLHDYEETGQYTVTLNVSDGVNYTTSSVTVTVVKEKTSSNNNLPVVIGIVVVVAVVVAAIILLKRRGLGSRMKREEEDVRLP